MERVLIMVQEERSMKETGRMGRWMAQVLLVLNIGVLTFGNGARFEGQFKDNKKNGKGILLNHSRNLQFR